jgi:D-alanyl-D-alanine carboxypeptidase
MGKSLILFFALILQASLSGFAATEPVESAPGGDSIAPIDYSGLTGEFPLVKDTNLWVNEGEVKAGLLYDVENNKIVWEKNLNSVFPIASLTKMMGALLTIEDINSGKYNWDDTVKWTRTSVVGKRKHRRTVHSTAIYSLRDVFKASMIASNNECAEQLARYIGDGNLPATIERMNQRARELGMLSTFYGNPTGLPSPNWLGDNSSTPTDQLRLTLEMLKYPEILDIAKMGYATIENGKSASVIRNHNRLTIDYSGEVDGLKTGYTKRAGFCLVATTAKCDHRLVSIVLGSRGPQIRNEVVRDMINHYYTSIGLDPLGPYCPNPLLPNPSLAKNNQQGPGEYVTVTEKVKKIHLVKGGENLSVIAGKYKCTTAQLKSWNKGKVKGTIVYKGQKLFVYTNVNKKVFIAKEIPASEEEDEKPVASEEISTTSPADTSAIAQAHVVVAPVAKNESLKVADKVVKADKTSVSKVVAKPKIEKPKYIYHTVAPGDTLFNIAQRYQGVSVAELKTLNNIQKVRSLKPGMKLKVKVRA